MSIVGISVWSSIVDLVTFNVAELEETTSLTGKYLEVANSVASALHEYSNIGVRLSLENSYSSAAIVQKFAVVDDHFDSQPENVKLVIWAAYAVIFENEAQDEAQARLLNATRTGNLAKTLRLRHEDVGEQEARRFAEAVFGAKSIDLVAEWICGGSMFVINE
jgi:hypothetical protein